MTEQLRFRAGDNVIVRDLDGWEKCRGKALQTRGYTGWAAFQVEDRRGSEVWVHTLTLNDSQVEVIN